MVAEHAEVDGGGGAGPGVGLPPPGCTRAGRVWASPTRGRLRCHAPQDAGQTPLPEVKTRPAIRTNRCLPPSGVTANPTPGFFFFFLNDPPTTGFSPLPHQPPFPI